MFCFIGIHKYSLIREVDFKKYFECDKCEKRIVKAESCHTDGRNYEGHNALADIEWLRKKRNYPRNRLEILGPRPKLKR